MRYGPDNPEITYVEHAYPEHLFDTGEVRLNYATTGSSDRPPCSSSPPRPSPGGVTRRR